MKTKGLLEDLNELRRVAEEKRGIVDSLTDDNRTGCCLAIWDDNRDAIMEAPDVVMMIGTVSDPEKWAKYLRLCIEKGARLFSNTGDITSSQSANEDEEKYGGSIRVLTAQGRRYRVSVSGLRKGIADETVGILIVDQLEGLSLEHMQALAVASENDLWALAA